MAFVPSTHGGMVAPQGEGFGHADWPGQNEFFVLPYPSGELVVVIIVPLRAARGPGLPIRGEDVVDVSSFVDILAGPLGCVGSRTWSPATSVPSSPIASGPGWTWSSTTSASGR